MKLKKCFGLFAVSAIAVAAGWNYQQRNPYEGLSGLGIANVEALASGEGGSGSGYCTMHLPYFNGFGNRTGEYSASSYTGPNCNGPFHSHNCSSCNHV